MVLISVLTMAVASASPPVPRLAAPGLQNANTSAKVVEFFNETFAQQLVLEGLKVTTANEIQALIGFERQKQLLGCSDESSSCLAELAGALGVDGLITGSVAKFGETVAINLKIVAARDSRTLSAASVRLKGEEQVLEWLAAQAKRSADDVRRELGAMRPPKVTAAQPVTRRPEPPVTVTTEAPAPSGPGLRPHAWIPATVGGAALLVGGMMYAQSASARDALRRGGDLPASTSITQYVEQNQNVERAGVVLGGVGVLGLAAGATMFLWPSEAPSRVGAFVAPNGAAFTFTTTLP